MFDTIADKKDGLKNVLVDEMLVKLERFATTKNKRRNAYVLTTNRIVFEAPKTRAFLVSKIDGNEAGRKRWKLCR